MIFFDNESIIRIIAGFAVVVAALIAGMIGLYTQWKLKEFDIIQTQLREKQSKRLKYYIPLLRCLYELDDRLLRIFKSLDQDWLDSKYLTAIKKKTGFATNPKEKGYFIISSIYLLGSFFGATEAIKKGVDTTRIYFETNKTKSKFFKIFNRRLNKSIFQFDPGIATISSLLQNKQLFDTYIPMRNFRGGVRDATEIHQQIQRSIGEMMLVKEGKDGYRVKTFREFYQLYVDDESFRFWFGFIEGYFLDLCNFTENTELENKVELKNDIRPLRLLAIQYWCRKLMANISKELELDEFNFETRKPDEVLVTTGIGSELNNIITSYKVENSWPYMIDIKINRF